MKLTSFYSYYDNTSRSHRWRDVSEGIRFAVEQATSYISATFYCDGNVYIVIYTICGEATVCHVLEP